MHAPALVDVEATQTLRGLLRASKIDQQTAELGRAALAQLGLRRHPDARLLGRSWQPRDVCTIYDALYVALTEALDATLVTPGTVTLLAASPRSFPSPLQTDRGMTRVGGPDRIYYTDT